MSQTTGGQMNPKCNWKNWVWCRHSIGPSVTCDTNEECEHKAQPAQQPLCPKCSGVLSRDDHNNRYVCVTEACDWYQPDAEQRPKMPAPRYGYHYEYRTPTTYDTFYGLDGIWHKLSITEQLDHRINGGKRWIAIRDEPATDQTTKLCGKPSQPCGMRTDRGLCWGPSECSVQDPVKTPVVRWWKSKQSDGYCKTADNRVMEHSVKSVSSEYLGWTPTLEYWIEITESEYEAAKLPTVVVATIKDRFTALERRVEELERGTL